MPTRMRRSCSSRGVEPIGSGLVFRENQDAIQLPVGASLPKRGGRRVRMTGRYGRWPPAGRQAVDILELLPFGACDSTARGSAKMA
jgi:hypothetical protein